ncbi:MAG: hypothetical protein JOZ25_03430 [Actinobacteria bacterium]|nr:hypothetical protein [Actinomycetota bacterium]
MTAARWRLAAFMAAVVPLACGLLVAQAGVGLLYGVPVALLALLLLVGRFPGEDLLVRAALRRRRIRRGLTLAKTRRRPPMALVPRGGLLLATALAGRAPPSRAVARAGSVCIGGPAIR